ncbi:type IV toxin-antitoxin system AbiEi family antitoxin [Corynebacterium sp. Marseille-P3884]|uniref:type IV toxin-antitoxin system AbiEi family antitoxin n=1 Tax=Corynebacterium sp. Marseille-P3884 TaxID=2495409 RepID=UPI001B32B0D1|nr:hypothetical protein [Corynebacterium sp. Marseille-P3884]
MGFLEIVNDGLSSAFAPIRLEDLSGGLEGGAGDGKAVLVLNESAGGERILVPARIFEATLTRREAERIAREGTLVIAEQIPPGAADALRRSGTMFVDQRGNCYYRDGQRLIDIRGRTGGPTRKKKRGQQSHALNLFTPKRSQVAAVILSYPRVLELPVGDIAKTAGVSFGTVVNTLKMFVETGYLTRRGNTYAIARDRFTTFLDAWADAFPTGLAAHLEVFRGSGDVARLEGDLDDAWVSGEAAVPEKIKGGDFVHLYIKDSQKLSGYLRRGRLRFSSSGEIVMRSAFWDLGLVLPGGVDSPRINTVVGPLPRVPLALLYADLRTAGDPRLSEISETISGELKEQAWNA